MNAIRKGYKKSKNALPKLKSTLKVEGTDQLNLSTNMNGKLESLFQVVEEIDKNHKKADR